MVGWYWLGLVFDILCIRCCSVVVFLQFMVLVMWLMVMWFDLISMWVWFRCMFCIRVRVFLLVVFCMCCDRVCCDMVSLLVSVCMLGGLGRVVLMCVISWVISVLLLVSMVGIINGVCVWWLLINSMCFMVLVSVMLKCVCSRCSIRLVCVKVVLVVVIGLLVYIMWFVLIVYVGFYCCSVGVSY